MEITFTTADLREICRSQDVAEEVLSRLGAKKLRTIVASMRAAATAAQFMSVHTVTPDDHGFSVDLTKTEILRVDVGQLSIPKKEGCTDWSNVYRIKIISIEGADV